MRISSAESREISLGRDLLRDFDPFMLLVPCLAEDRRPMLLDVAPIFCVELALWAVLVDLPLADFLTFSSLTCQSLYVPDEDAPADAIFYLPFIEADGGRFVFAACYCYGWKTTGGDLALCFLLFAVAG